MLYFADRTDFTYIPSPLDALGLDSSHSSSPNDLPFPEKRGLYLFLDPLDGVVAIASRDLGEEWVCAHLLLRGHVLMHGHEHSL